MRGSSDDDLAAVELTPGGYGLHWETLDADLGIAGLLTGFFGSKSWMDSLRREMQAKGGRAKTAAKAAAVRENGKTGGLILLETHGVRADSGFLGELTDRELLHALLPAPPYGNIPPSASAVCAAP